MTYKVSLQFQDRNMPGINVNCPTLQSAMNEGAHLQATYAALRSVTILRPDNSKLVFNGAGVYQFTIPALEVSR